jgi:hypothetical protein
MAETTRTLGALGTVEEAYKPKDSRRYRRSSAPKRTIPSAIHGTIPSQKTRAKRASIEAQHARRAKPVSNHGGQALWIEFIGYNASRDYYGIRVKVRGMAATDQWVPYHLASTTWYEVTGTDIADYMEG